MSARVRVAARDAGVPRSALPLLERAHDLAMRPRVHALEERAHELLHPGRTVLILLLDTSERSAEVLAAAMLVDSESERLAVTTAEAREVLGEDVSRWLAAVPRPDAEDLVERLVTAEEEVQRIVLAERLDQLRHAHLWNDAERRRRAHEQALSVYSPLAERGHENLARRYVWWCSMFARKYLAGI